MNAKIMTRLAVFAVAGSLLAGCATQQGYVILPVNISPMRS
jgi:hypothetical protein